MSHEATLVLKALSDEQRLSMIARVFESGELSCQQLSEKFSLSQPTMSHHLGKLIDAKILLVRKEGVAHFYRVNTSFLAGLGINLKKMIPQVAAI